ncbi:hypothetical protein Gotur_012383 [Gossypium turneri]
MECYMKQYRVSMQEAYNELYKQINNAWKDINEEFLKPTASETLELGRKLSLGIIRNEEEVIEKEASSQQHDHRCPNDEIKGVQAYEF